MLQRAQVITKACKAQCGPRKHSNEPNKNSWQFSPIFRTKGLHFCCVLGPQTMQEGLTQTHRCHSGVQIASLTKLVLGAGGRHGSQLHRHVNDHRLGSSLWRLEVWVLGAADAGFLQRPLTGCTGHIHTCSPATSLEDHGSRCTFMIPFLLKSVL